VLDMLSEIGMLGCKAANAFIEVDVKLPRDQKEILDDPSKYQR